MVCTNEKRYSLSSVIAKLKLHILPMVHATSNLVWGVLVTFVIIVTFVIFVTFVIIVRDPLKKVTNFRALPESGGGGGGGGGYPWQNLLALL